MEILPLAIREGQPVPCYLCRCDAQFRVRIRLNSWSRVVVPLCNVCGMESEEEIIRLLEEGREER